MIQPRVNDLQQRYGEPDKSPCASSRLLTPACGDAAGAMAAVSGSALREIKPAQDFPTLRNVATHLTKAESDYRRLGCADGPSDADTVAACRKAGDTLARGPRDLNNALLVALRGQ
nr:hypothetical protein [Streptomyces sp. DSM 41633]